MTIKLRFKPMLLPNTWAVVRLPNGNYDVMPGREAERKSQFSPGKPAKVFISGVWPDKDTAIRAMHKIKSRVDERVQMSQRTIEIKGRCPECVADKQVACPRDVDGQCLECGAKLCARHLMIHFQKVHVMSLEWRGNLK
jgi:hypothetical protein